MSATYSVKIEGFRTKKQALEFLSWYEGGGEQAFYEHLPCRDMDPKDGCNIDVSHNGNTGGYYDVNGTEISAKVRLYED